MPPGSTQKPVTARGSSGARADSPSAARAEATPQRAPAEGAHAASRQKEAEEGSGDGQESEDECRSEGGASEKGAAAALIGGGSSSAPPAKPAPPASSVGAIWKMSGRIQQYTLKKGYTVVQAIQLPEPLVSSLLSPRAKLPLPITVQILIDGNPLGPRFSTRISPGNTIKSGLTVAADLVTGCWVESARITTTGPQEPSLDLLLLSTQEGATARGGIVGTRAFLNGLGRALDPADFGSDVWPQNESVTAENAHGLSLKAPACLWPNTAQPPKRLRVQVYLDGVSVRAPLEARLRFPTGPRVSCFVCIDSRWRLPLPVGSTIVRLRRAAPDLVQVYACSGQQQGPQQQAQRRRRQQAQQQQVFQEAEGEGRRAGGQQQRSSAAATVVVGQEEEQEGPATATAAPTEQLNPGRDEGKGQEQSDETGVATGRMKQQERSTGEQQSDERMADAAPLLQHQQQQEQQPEQQQPGPGQDGEDAARDAAPSQQQCSPEQGENGSEEEQRGGAEVGEEGDGRVEHGPAAAAEEASAAAAAPAAVPARPILVGRQWEAEDMTPDTWPVNQTFSTQDRQKHHLRVPMGFWGGATPPAVLRLQVWLDGSPVGSPLDATARVYQSEPSQCHLITAAWLPLAVGTAILRFKRAGPDLLEVYARSSSKRQHGEQAATGVGAAAAQVSSGPSLKKQRLAVESSPQTRQGPPSPQTPPGTSSAALPPSRPSAALPLAQRPLPPLPLQPLAVSPTAAAPASDGLRGAPASTTSAQQTAPVVAASAGTDEDPAAAGVLQALQLAEIKAPQAMGTDAAGQVAARAALEAAVFEAYREVERAATALGLPIAAVDAVCRYVNAATEQPAAARRFLRMEYSRLVRAAAVGEVGVARSWMESAAAAE